MTREQSDPFYPRKYSLSNFLKINLYVLFYSDYYLDDFHGKKAVCGIKAGMEYLLP